MLDYVVRDFKNTRIAMDDHTIGGMVICDSSDQAKKMYEVFTGTFGQSQADLSKAAEPPVTYGEKKEANNNVDSAAVILHDVGTKEERKDIVDDFKDGKI